MNPYLDIYLVSNMYPSPKDPAYGIFVRNFAVNIEKSNDIRLVCKTLIQGRGVGKINKLLKYINFYSSFIWQFVFSRYHVCYIHYILHVAPVVLILNVFKKRKIVYNIHGSDISLVTNKTLLWMLKKALHSSIMIVVPSEYFKLYLLQKFPDLNSYKIFVSPSAGINKKFKPPQLKINKNEFVIGYVSRISKEKGWFTFLDALKMLKQNGANFKVIVAGKESTNGEVKSTLSKYDLQNEVEYVGVVEHDNLPSLYQNLSVFVFPSELNESLGLVSLEAMACGVPVIGSDSGAIPYYLENGKNGLIFKAKDAKLLYKCFLKIMKWNTDEYAKVSSQAVQFAQNYEEEKVMSTLIKELLKRST